MSSWTAHLRRIQAEQRRMERDAQRRQKDLERQLKEEAKLTEIERAKLEVEAHENALEILLSVHKERSAPMDWARYFCAPVPHEPINYERHAFSAQLNNLVPHFESTPTEENRAEEYARLRDQQSHEAAEEEHGKKSGEWRRMRALAKRVLAGESGAYSEAISEFSSVSEIPGLGSSLHVTIYNPRLVICMLTVNGREVIPAEVKSLTKGGKLSVKAMAKSRFHEIYQDYVCGCALRLAREMFALLPIETTIVTASVNGIDSRNGLQSAMPVLSVALTRAALEQLDFERLDSSDAMENFPHRGEVTASRRSGDFVSIVPFTPADLEPNAPKLLEFNELIAKVRLSRAEIASKLKVDAAAITGDAESSFSK